jgi:hypothetical protein
MTSGDTLRRAAALLRDRAQALPDHLAAAPRVVQSDSEQADALAWCDIHDGDPDAACDGCFTAELTHPALAGWLALMHPAVGTTLAHWLDVQATAADWSVIAGLVNGSQTRAALAVATAVLHHERVTTTTEGS